jgi:regulator of sigma E protease
VVGRAKRAIAAGMSVLYFLVLVGVLVVVHELGHFAAAKLLDVKVLRFSLGYGRPLVRVTLRETEYQIGIFPLGGYVRILGVEDEERPGAGDAGRSFAARPLWQRLTIIFAGPAANFLLAVAIYFVFFAGHTQLPAAVIGDVLADSPAARAGLAPGDRVLAIDGSAVRYWEEVEERVQAAAGRELHVRLERNGKPFERYVVPIEEIVRRRDGEAQAQGRIGITRARSAPLVGVLDPGSPAHQAGLRTGDLVISLDGHPIDGWADVTRKLERGRRTNVVYFRATPVDGVPHLALYEARFADLVPDHRLGDTLERTTYTGLERAEMFVAHVDPGSPADVAGLHPGDLILALDDQPVVHWAALDQRLQADPGRTWQVTFQRTAADGRVETHTARLTQVWRKQTDAYGHTVERLVFGARNATQHGRVEMVPIEGRLGYAISRAIDRTGETIAVMVSATVAILKGDSPSETLGGPVMMYKVASVSGEQGWDTFLLMMALISVNLGLINLLPVPILDGGHVLIFAIEGVRRRPLSERARERIQLAGLILVGVLTVLALKNDVMRYFL